MRYPKPPLNLLAGHINCILFHDTLRETEKCEKSQELFTFKWVFWKKRYDLTNFWYEFKLWLYWRRKAT